MNPSILIPKLDPAELERRRTLTGILEYAIVSLELTPQQRESIEKTYREVGKHLARALGVDDPDADIFAQGSYRLGTVIRPWRNVTQVFDLDLVFHFKTGHWDQDAKKFRDIVGEHLRKVYGKVLKPLPKGWRLDYSEERGYYLDIIPAMNSVPGQVIAITVGAGWQDTNPRGYAAWFQAIAEILPNYGLVAFANEARMNNRSTTIEPLPEHTDFKEPLKRITQIAKRARDYHFHRRNDGEELSPASIVVTTLLALSYEASAPIATFESGYELLVTCVKGMTDYIEVWRDANGRKAYRIKNPSLLDENLVKKWNDDARLAPAFYEWHAGFVALLEQLSLPAVSCRRLLTEVLGEEPVRRAFQKQSELLNAARDVRMLAVTPLIGITTAPGLTVPNYRIHGDE